MLTRDGVPVRNHDLASSSDRARPFVAAHSILMAKKRSAVWSSCGTARTHAIVIERVKAKIAALESELDGIKIRGVYDRTLLIDETVATLAEALAQETLITIVVMVLFLLHVRASLVIAITLPMAVVMSFIAMKTFGVDANIMSLAGIAIAIGTMVDMGIICLENIYGGVAEWEAEGCSGAVRPSND